MRITQVQVSVALAFMSAPDEDHWMYALTEKTGFRSGALSGKLKQLASEGWLVETWEDPKDRDRTGPLRHYYTVTAKGKSEFTAVLAKAASDPRFAHMGIGRSSRLPS